MGAVYVSGELQCKAVSSAATDAWCNTNCNHDPPYCPTSLCQCDGPAPPTPAPPSPAPAPSPDPTQPPAPVPPAPSPSPPTPAPSSGFKVSGPWYYIADGNTKAHAFNATPSWMHETQNIVSLAFMDPADLSLGTDAVPVVFRDVAAEFLALGQTVFFSIGGAAYGGHWGWLQDPAQSEAYGKTCASIAKMYHVGIEIDYEGGADPTAGLVAFVQGFRSACPMGTCSLTMDLFGGPGGAGWQKEAVPKLVPSTGEVGEAVGDGNWLDYANVMVIDGQPVTTAITYWQQWADTGVLNFRRAAFSLDAGFPGLGICDGTKDQDVDSVVEWLGGKQVYGVMYWAICPPTPGAESTCGDWTSSCNAASPGFSHLCSTLGTCTASNVLTV